MKEKVLAFVKKDFVFVIAVLLAVASMLLVPPSAAYLAYFDFAVLGTLFCLMCVVAGLQRCGLLGNLSQRLLGRVGTIRGISVVLVALCFFCSMLLTNDVALIAFVPLTLLTLPQLSSGRLIYLVVLETVAANLGSMLTPIGNPQNLYLYARYQLSLGDFVGTVAPVWAVSLVLLALLLLPVSRQRLQPSEQQPQPLDRRGLLLYLLLFFLCIATVLRLLDYRLCTLVTLGVLLCCDRPVLRRVDYLLLGTFAAFFVLVGNLSNTPAVSEALARLMQGRELLTTLLVSQVISNVPAAIMLSGFTDNAAALLLGSNIGGLGTLVASLASLISYKFYAAHPGAQPLRYLGVFTLLNLALLVLLGLLGWALGL